MSERYIGYDVEAGVWSKYRGSSLVRPAQHAELSRNDPDPELFSHSMYDDSSLMSDIREKMPYLTFCNKMRQFLI